MTTGYLTIDDAPASDLPEKLDILREYDVPAIFFCEGRKLEAHPDRARQAIEAGMTLGNHAYSHTHASELSVAEFREEIKRTESLLESIYDETSQSRPARLFRFPYGDLGGDRAASFQEVLGEWGFSPIDATQIDYDWYQERHADNRDWFWTIEVEDWNATSRADLEAELAADRNRLDSNSADVLLFHDGGNSPQLLASFIELLSERGVQFEDPLDLVAKTRR